MKKSLLIYRKVLQRGFLLQLDSQMDFDILQA